MPDPACPNFQGSLSNSGCQDFEFMRSVGGCGNMSNSICPNMNKGTSVIPPPGNPCYPLANPLGTDLKCEVCSKPAFLQCSLCRVTYYWYVEAYHPCFYFNQNIFTIHAITTLALKQIYKHKTSSSRNVHCQGFT